LRHQARRRNIWLGSLLAALLIVSSAIAAITYLGQPAPRKVKQEFQKDNAAKGAFGDAPLHVPLVDPNSAQTVAVSGHAVLYGAEGKGGNYCTVLVVNGKPQRTPSVRCELGVWPLAMRLDYKNFVWANESTAPLVFSGRLSRHGRSLTARYANGLMDRVRVGLRGYFVYEPAAVLQHMAKTTAIRLIERDRLGTITDTQVLQPPVAVSAQSHHAPHAITGQVLEAGAKYVAVTVFVHLGRIWGDQQGRQQIIKLDPDGRFRWRASGMGNQEFFVSLGVLDRDFRHIVDDIEIG
jgi:hypothetical protein